MFPKFIFFLLFPFLSVAHPSIAIKFDSKGNLYYSDLYRVYKITPAGEKTVVVPNVHTHELSIDKYDNVYGEHLWYEGDATKKWGHYVWKLSSSGTLTRIKDSTEGFLKNYSFLRDSLDNLYVTERPEKEGGIVVFKKIDPHGAISIIAQKKFENIRWQFVDPGGTLYFYDIDDLYRLSPDGKFYLLAKDLGSPSGPFSFEGHIHSMMGMWMDNTGNLYVANFSGQEVKKISKSGEIKVVYTTKDLWSPTGGAFDKNNNLWLLEGAPMGECRITKVTKTSQESTLSANLPQSSTLGMNYKTFLALIPVIIFIGWLLLRRKEKQIADNNIH